MARLGTTLTKHCPSRPLIQSRRLRMDDAWRIPLDTRIESPTTTRQAVGAMTRTPIGLGCRFASSAEGECQTSGRIDTVQTIPCPGSHRWKLESLFRAGRSCSPSRAVDDARYSLVDLECRPDVLIAGRPWLASTGKLGSAWPFWFLEWFSGDLRWPQSRVTLKYTGTHRSRDTAPNASAPRTRREAASLPGEIAQLRGFRPRACLLQAHQRTRTTTRNSPRRPATSTRPGREDSHGSSPSIGEAFAAWGREPDDPKSRFEIFGAFRITLDQRSQGTALETKSGGTSR